jgi:hypothetical protein
LLIAQCAVLKKLYKTHGRRPWERGDPVGPDKALRLNGWVPLEAEFFEVPCKSNVRPGKDAKVCRGSAVWYPLSFGVY